MIKINQLKLKIEHTEADIFAKVLHELPNLNKADIKNWFIDRKSIDARKKTNLFYVYSIVIELEHEKQEEKLVKKMKNKNIQIISKKKYTFTAQGNQILIASPIVVGAGPSGLFCAYELALRGYCPIIVERGASVEERVKDVEDFWKTGVLNTESNVQFGEGGAGTFSDGKLNTGVKDPLGRNRRVLEVFVEHGAPEDILYDSKPHIGTDILIDVVRNMRNHILALGGCVLFHTKVSRLLIENQKVQGVEVVKSDGTTDVLNSEVIVLAIGHSARDMFSHLQQECVPMEAKSFAVGVRVEHSQHMINQSQYGEIYSNQLPPSPYKLTANLASKRGVYSFCMCPGGYVVNASSEAGMLAVNGMSYSKRDSSNANSAIVVTVNPSDYLGENDDVLAGMYFQRELEQKAFACGQGKIPVQLYGDFCNNISSTGVKSIVPQIKGEFSPTNLRQILPGFIGDSILEGMQIFGRKIHGFDHPDVVLSGVESRTSSPVRILRNQEFESTVKGLYPCGEGAGYAGGITSAAIDGIKVFEAIATRYDIPKSDNAFIKN